MTFAELESKVTSLEADVKVLGDTLADVDGRPRIRSHSHAALELNGNLNVAELMRRLGKIEDRMASVLGAGAFLRKGD